MVFQNEQEVIDAIKKVHSPPSWINEARANSKKLTALVSGEGFTDLLIEQIEKIESSARKIARKKYSKDIRDVFNRIFTPRENVFSANGTSMDNTLSDSKSEIVHRILDNFKGNKSIHQYFADYFFEMLDKDPNGLIFMEYIEDKEIYPTYKATKDIRFYKSNGQNIEYVIFEPKTKEIKSGGVAQLPASTVIKTWRVVDDEMDYCVKEINGTLMIDPDTTKTFKHPFRSVPAVILSSLQKVGTEIRYSPVFPIEALAEDYARDKSVLTVYKFLSGFPIQWRYVQYCRSCQGVGKTGKTDEKGNPISCTSCGGKGRMGTNDVTDIIELPLPKDSDDAKVAPDLAGFVSPDLKTWEQMRKDQREDEIRMEDTIWGTHKVTDAENTTATGKFIDVQPVINKLNTYADNVEWCMNQLIEFVINWMNGGAETDDKLRISLGRSYIIESPDTILDRYEDARIKGSNFTILDKLLNEYLMSKYKNNPALLEKEVKKTRLEPYVHISVKDVKDIFGGEEAERKELFGQFWQQADKEKDIETLRLELDKYVIDVRNSALITADEKVRKLLSQMPDNITAVVLGQLSSEETRALIGKTGSKPIEATDTPII